MNLFDVSEDYACKSKIRTRDASTLAQKIRSEMKPGEQVATILDIGCGTGYTTLELATRFSKARVIGIDSNPSYIDRAPLLARNVEFYCVDISKSGGGGDGENGSSFAQLCSVTSLAVGTVSIAISSYWLSSLEPLARTAAIAAVQRLLRPNGSLYLLDLVWTDAFAVMAKLNQEERWKKLLAAVASSASAAKSESTTGTPFKIALPESTSPPSNEQVSAKWIKQFEEELEQQPPSTTGQQQRLELYQIVRNKLNYRFKSLEEMLHVLESLCATVHQLDADHAHMYFVDFVRALFDQLFFVQNSLTLSYVSLLVVAHKKGGETIGGSSANYNSLSGSVSVQTTPNSITSK